MTDLQTRSFQVRLTHRADPDDDAREVEGLAVPYGVETEICPGLREVIAPGAVTEPEDDTVKLFSRHRDPIGVVTASHSDDDGYHITARISRTPAGDEALTLLRDGVIARMSIGFEEIEWTDTEDETGYLRTQERIRVREVSVVPFPAYPTATITNVRHTEETDMDTTTSTPTDTRETLATVQDSVAAVQEDLADVRRDLAFLRTTPTPTATPTDTREAGQWLKDLATGKDTDTIRAYDTMVARAWDGTTSSADANTTTPTWIGDLTRLYNQTDPLKNLFSTGSLPSTGMRLSYTELDTSTIAVTEQANEGDDLVLGKLTTKNATAPIRTFGGYTSLSRQAIERTEVNILSRHLEGMALAAGKASAAAFASVFATAVKAQAAAALTLPSTTWADLSALVVDAAAAFADQALSLDGLIVDKATFKTLAALTGADGRPLMSVSNTGANTAGTMNLTGLSGNLVGLTVTPNLRQVKDQLGTGVTGAFYNSAAIRSYETSLVQLQDENIINLTKDYSVYRYSAWATEIPTALIPLKATA
nr:HK97 family phage prohead protease [Actinomyces sp.]